MNINVCETISICVGKIPILCAKKGIFSSVCVIKNNIQM